MKRSFVPNIVGCVGVIVLAACLPTITTSTQTATPTAGAIKSTSTQPVTIKMSGGYARQIAWAPGSRQLAVASKGVSIFDVKTLAEIRSIETPHSVQSVAFSPDGALVAAGLSGDGNLRAWKTTDWSFVRTLEGHKTNVNVVSLLFSPDGQILASGADDNTICLSRVSDGTLVRTLAGHTSDVRSIAFSPNGQMLASASRDNTVRVWRVSDGVTLLTLRQHTSDVLGVAFSPDGQMLASASTDHSVRLWRVSDDTLLRTIEAPGTWYVVAFAPDGQTVAAGGSDNSMRFWKIADGAQVRQLTGHSGYVRQIAFSPDGRTLASAGADETVRLWSVEQ